jgi:D-alanyl-D-alanine carboxypeptidase
MRTSARTSDPQSFVPLPNLAFHTLVAPAEEERPGYAIIMGLITSLALGPVGVLGQTPDPHLPAAIDSLVEAELARRQPFAGMEIAVVLEGDTVYRRIHGLAQVELDVPLSRNAVFQIASLTKEFTAAAILRLVEEGRITLDDDIRDYLPDVPTGGYTVRIRHLLNHTSGIPNIYEMPAWPEIRPLRLDRAGTRVRVLEAMADQGMDFEPGTDSHYSNTGYDLLGDLIERISGTDVESYFRETFFEPLGLERTSMCPWSRIIPGRVPGYEADGDSLVNAFRQSQGVLYTSGGLCSTVDDLLRWNQAIHGGSVLRVDSHRLMTTPEGAARTYAFGLYVRDVEGHRVLYRNGYINGYSSQLDFYPDDDLTIVVLTNTPAAVAGLTEDIARRVFGLGPRPRATPPQGWIVRAVPEGADTSAINFRTMGRGVHVTAGPGAIYFHRDSLARRPYTLAAEFVQFATPDPDGGLGLVFGGRELMGPKPEFLRFLVRGSGEYAVLRRGGDEEEALIPWTPSPAIAVKRSVGNATNALRVVIDDSVIRLIINDQQVASFPLTSDGDADGVVGLWIGAGADIHIDAFGYRLP